MKRREQYELLLTPTKTNPELCRMLYLAVGNLYMELSANPNKYGITKAAASDLYNAVEWHYLTTRPKRGQPEPKPYTNGTIDNR